MFLFLMKAGGDLLFYFLNLWVSPVYGLGQWSPAACCLLVAGMEERYKGSPGAFLFSSPEDWEPALEDLPAPGQAPPGVSRSVTPQPVATEVIHSSSSQTQGRKRTHLCGLISFRRVAQVCAAVWQDPLTMASSDCDVTRTWHTVSDSSERFYRHRDEGLHPGSPSY